MLVDRIPNGRPNAVYTPAMILVSCLCLNCTKFGWISLQTPLESLQRPRAPLAGFKLNGAYFSANLFTVDSASCAIA